MDDKTRPDDTGYRFIGKRIPRKEDERLITGKGRFTDDFNLVGQAHAAIVRSPYPHARIVAIRTEAAPLDLAPAVEKTIWQIRPGQPITYVGTLESDLDQMGFRERLSAIGSTGSRW